MSDIPQKAPHKEDKLLSLIGKGNNLPAIRAHFSEAFWQGKFEKPRLMHLYAAMAQKDRDLMKLLVTYGAPTPSSADMDTLTKCMPDPDLYRHLKHCGMKLPPKAGDIVSDRDCPAPQIPAEWKGLIQAMHCFEADTLGEKNGAEAIIAGGALRDLYNERPVKDVDIFLYNTGSTRKNRQFLKKCFKEAGIDIEPQSVTIRGEYFDKTVQKDLVLKRSQDKGENWYIKSQNSGTLYNIVFLDPPPQHLRGLYSFLLTSWYFKNTDIGLCQIVYDGKTGHALTSAAYRKDVTDHTLTALNPENLSVDHAKRVMDKYPDFTPCPQLQAYADSKIKKDPRPPGAVNGGIIRIY